jgi:hypothetical protein
LDSPSGNPLAKSAECEWRALFPYWGRRLVPDSELETELDPKSDSNLKSVGPGTGLVRIWQTPCSSSSSLQSGFRMGPFQD